MPLTHLLLGCHLCDSLTKYVIDTYLSQQSLLQRDEGRTMTTSELVSKKPFAGGMSLDNAPKPIEKMPTRVAPGRAFASPPAMSVVPVRIGPESPILRALDHPDAPGAREWLSRLADAVKQLPSRVQGDYLKQLAQLIGEGNFIGARMLMKNFPDSASRSIGELIEGYTPFGRPADLQFKALQKSPQYKALPVSTRISVNTIYQRVRHLKQASFYTGCLVTAVKTPYRSSEVAAADDRGILDSYLNKTKPAKTGASGDVEVDTQRVWTKVNQDGRIFYVDARDPLHIHTFVRVHLKADPSDPAAPKTIEKIKQLKGAIERAGSVSGDAHGKGATYEFRVAFVDKGGPDVMDVTVKHGVQTNRDRWTERTPGTYAHEIHHHCGLPDRYDYVCHVFNDRMEVENRLDLLRIQIERDQRRPDPDFENSIMNAPDTGTVLDDDACKVAGLDDKCVQQRRFAISKSASIEDLEEFEALMAGSPELGHQKLGQLDKLAHDWEQKYAIDLHKHHGLYMPTEADIRNAITRFEAAVSQYNEMVRDQRPTHSLDQLHQAVLKVYESRLLVAQNRALKSSAI